MHKHIILLAIAVLLLSVGLSGCVDISDNGEHTNDNLVSFYELDNELYKYADKEISIEGNILWILGKSWNKSTYIGKLEDWDYSGFYIDIIIPTDINILNRVDYTITGIVREPEIYGDNPIIEVTSAKLAQSLPDDEHWWACGHGLSFVEEYISTQSEYAYWSETGFGHVHQGVFHAIIYISFHTEDGIAYKNKYTVAMELNENSDMTDIDSWKLLSIDEEVDIWDHIPDI